ncbi:hypothetical protein BDN72DRAFT_521470 [Pluteus cervinus]|uniref:Uncharacterized protein n=1 Tax=Pluteus cervinus TaxID=181527 RepID=A0ACD3AZK1_9AGAR|nr:hypothetical protein BDN72DRAFT_521470 [Pluteus cervinus]
MTRNTVRFDPSVTEIYEPGSTRLTPGSSSRAGFSTIPTGFAALRHQAAGRVIRSQPRRPLRAFWETSNSDTSSSSSSSPSPPATPHIPTIPLPGTPSAHLNNLRLFVWDDIANQLKEVADQPATHPPCQSMTFVDPLGIIQDMVVTAGSRGYVDIRDVLVCLERFVSRIDTDDWECNASEQERSDMGANWLARRSIMGPKVPTIIDMHNCRYFVGVEALEDEGDCWVFNFSA